MLKSLRPLATAVVLCAPFLGGASGCENKETCNEAIRVTRDALSKEHTAVARQWRDYAWKVCSDQSQLAPLDQEIVAKEAEVKKRAEDEAKRVADAAKKRMDTAQRVWLNFDKEEEEKQTLDRLETYRDKAEKMSEGLPDEYKKQIDAYNAKEFARRQRNIKKREEKK
jgi:hypothetical protein